MKHLYFVRHGQSEMNVAEIFAGITDTPLTKEGRRQAKETAQKIKEIKIDTIVCSPLSRAKETAEIIAREIGYPFKNIHINKLFVERDFGELEGKPWSPDMDLDGFSDIETVDTILERARLAIEFLKTFKGHSILVVSHGSFGRALRSILKPEMPYHNRTSGGSTKSSGIKNAELHKWV